MSLLFTAPFRSSHAAPQEVHGVKGEKVALACNSSMWDEHSVSLVLWYKDASEVPIYTVDVRDAPLSKARQISSAYLKDRAYFDVTQRPPLFILANLTKIHDEGIYRCRVSNILFMEGDQIPLLCYNLV